MSSPLTVEFNIDSELENISTCFQMTNMGYFATKVEKASNGELYWAIFQKSFFGQGSSRYAYFGFIQNGTMRGKYVVGKIFKNEYCDSIDGYALDLTASTKANDFAVRYNSKNGIHLHQKKVVFLIPTLMTVGFVDQNFPDISINVKSGDTIAVEDFVPGNYVKFNSNGGYENGLSEYLLAFSHWTYAASHGTLMVCDLQGVETADGYYLTDPAIHTTVKGTYGATDLGTDGMELVLKNHECNRFCQMFGLRNPYAMQCPTFVTTNTICTFQLEDATKQYLMITPCSQFV